MNPPDNSSKKHVEKLDEYLRYAIRTAIRHIDLRGYDKEDPTMLILFTQAFRDAGWTPPTVNQHRGNSADPKPEQTKRGAGLKLLMDTYDLDTDECILWPYCTTGYGYGTVRYENKMVRTHRLSLMLTIGKPPEGKPYALHKCNTPPCYNSRHLYWGSAADNMRDALESGNVKKAKPPAFQRDVLTPDDVRTMRKRHKAGENWNLIALEYPQVKINAVKRAIKGRTWSHVK